MQDTFHWQAPLPQGAGSHRDEPRDRLSTWIILSLIGAILLHLALFIILGHIQLKWTLDHTKDEIVTDRVVVHSVEDIPLLEAPVNDIIEKPITDPKKLVDDIEVLDKIKEPELEMKPDVKVAAFDVDISIKNPALAGDPTGDTMHPAAEMQIPNSELETLGKLDVPTPPAAEGQIVIDPGGDPLKPDALDNYMDKLIKKGDNGLSPQGLPDGMKSLDAMLGLPENILVKSTTLLPGDLLFEYNSAELKSGAKVGLQKIALVMDRNPNLFCWIEGHTDTIGGEDFNLDLSLRRADAVKNYLVQSMAMNEKKISTLGLGKMSPIIRSGDANAQGINRRVEIKMRKSPATPISTNQTTQPQNQPPPPKAILVKPAQEPMVETPRKAIPVEETPPPPKATAIMEDPSENENSMPPSPPLKAQPIIEE